MYILVSSFPWQLLTDVTCIVRWTGRASTRARLSIGHWGKSVIATSNEFSVTEYSSMFWLGLYNSRSSFIRVYSVLILQKNNVVCIEFRARGSCPSPKSPVSSGPENMLLRIMLNYYFWRHQNIRPNGSSAYIHSIDRPTTHRPVGVIVCCCKGRHINWTLAHQLNKERLLDFPIG